MNKIDHSVQIVHISTDDRFCEWWNTSAAC